MIHALVFSLTTFLWCQFEESIIVTSDFLYSNKNNIHFILDESGQNTFILNKYYPFFMNDYSNNQVLVDGALQLPQGGYVFPELFSFRNVPDSVNNISQIHYEKGDYGLGELGLSLEIRQSDSIQYSFHGLTMSPPIIYSSSSWDDGLQNYLFNYKNNMDRGSIDLDIMYHFENHHFPLNSENVFLREVESFHSGLKIMKNSNAWMFDAHPAIQVSNINRDGSKSSFFTFWYDEIISYYFRKKINFYLKYDSKWIMSESEDKINEYNYNILRPGMKYDNENFVFDVDIAIIDKNLKPEMSFKWLRNNYFLSIDQRHSIYFNLLDQNKFGKSHIDVTSLKIGYLGNNNKFLFDFFSVQDSIHEYFGFGSELTMDFEWFLLSQKGSFHNQSNNNKSPIEIYNHLYAFLSPNVWFWRNARYQPFVGIELTSIKHSGMNMINPIDIPLNTLEISNQSFFANVGTMEFGITVKRFKVSYKMITSNLFGEKHSNSSSSFPVESISNLAIEWQFWN